MSPNNFFTIITDTEKIAENFKAATIYWIVPEMHNPFQYHPVSLLLLKFLSVYQLPFPALKEHKMNCYKIAFT